MTQTDHYLDTLGALCLVGAIVLLVMLVWPVVIARALKATNEQSVWRARWLILQRFKVPFTTGEHVLIVIALAGLYGAHATVKSSNRMAALQYISENASYVAQLEVSTPENLCIYEWSGPFRKAKLEGCGPEVFSKDGQLSKTFDEIQMYIEESLLFFAESTRMERRFDARFYGGLPYWRDDFQLDSTGAISYYIIGRELDQTPRLNDISPNSIACLEHLTDLRFTNICANYTRFVDSLNVPLSPKYRGQSCDHLNDLSRHRRSVSEKSCQGTWWAERFVGSESRRRR